MNVLLIVLLLTVVAVVLLIKRRRENYYASYAHYTDPTTGEPIDVDIAQHPLKAYLGAYPRWTEMSDSGAYPDLIIPSYDTSSGIMR